MDKTAEQMEKDPLSQAIKQALIQTAADNEILDPFYARRAGETDEVRDKRLNGYSMMPKAEVLRLAKEYQKSHSTGK